MAAVIDQIVHHRRLVEFGGESKLMGDSLMLGRKQRNGRRDRGVEFSQPNVDFTIVKHRYRAASGAPTPALISSSASAPTLHRRCRFWANCRPIPRTSFLDRRRRISAPRCPNSAHSLEFQLCGVETLLKSWARYLLSANSHLPSHCRMGNPNSSTTCRWAIWPSKNSSTALDLSSFVYLLTNDSLLPICSRNHPHPRARFHLL